MSGRKLSSSSVSTNTSTTKGARVGVRLIHVVRVAAPVVGSGTSFPSGIRDAPRSTTSAIATRSATSVREGQLVNTTLQVRLVPVCQTLVA